MFQQGSKILSTVVAFIIPVLVTGAGPFITHGQIKNKSEESRMACKIMLHEHSRIRWECMNF